MTCGSLHGPPAYSNFFFFFRRQICQTSDPREILLTSSY